MNIDVKKQCLWKEHPKQRRGVLKKLGITESKINDPLLLDHPPEYYMELVSNIDLNEPFKKRLAAIKNLPRHDYIAPIQSAAYSPKKNEAFIIYEYLSEAITYNKFLQKKIKLNTNSWKQMFHRLACGLAHMESHGLRHLNINPESVLVFLPGEDKMGETAPMVCLSSISIKIDNSADNSPFTHPELLKNGSQLGSPRMFQYEFWSYGLLIYLAMTDSHPFMANENFFNSHKVFKESLTTPDSLKKHIAKLKKTICDEFIINIVEMSWQANKMKGVHSWADVVRVFQSHILIPRIQKQAISSIAMKHIRLCFLLSQIYILIRTQIKFNFHDCWTKDPLFSRFAQSLMKLAYIHHEQVFLKYFYNRSLVLNYQFRRLLEEVGTYISNELKFIKNGAPYQPLFEQLSLQRLMEILKKTPIKLKMTLHQIPKNEYSKSMAIMSQFLEEFIECGKRQYKIKAEGNFQNEDYLTVILNSEKMGEIAVRHFGFALTF